MTTSRTEQILTALETALASTSGVGGRNPLPDSCPHGSPGYPPPMQTG